MNCAGMICIITWRKDCKGPADFDPVTFTKVITQNISIFSFVLTANWSLGYGPHLVFHI